VKKTASASSEEHHDAVDGINDHSNGYPEATTRPLRMRLPGFADPHNAYIWLV
jgi:hypothetical protein